jgi:NADH dehydrogenase/NADH:ubiquinone oxidoreductase subunit G
MVEIERSGQGELVTACSYPVREDITVSTTSERAARARRGVMALLLARSPDSEELRELASRMGVTATPYPKVTESQRNCILCGLCVTVCEEAIGAAAIGFAGRGVEKAVAPPFRLVAEDCIACGACAAVCPVGTIQIRHHPETKEIEISPFKARVPLLECASCGADVVPERVSRETERRIEMDWEKMRERALLCPACRRKKMAASMSDTAAPVGG